jgi:hypothetical protein
MNESPRLGRDWYLVNKIPIHQSSFHSTQNCVATDRLKKKRVLQPQVSVGGGAIGVVATSEELQGLKVLVLLCLIE